MGPTPRLDRLEALALVDRELEADVGEPAYSSLSVSITATGRPSESTTSDREPGSSSGSPSLRYSS